MMKPGFWKASAWTEVITRVFELLSLTAFSPLVIAKALAATLRFILLGLRLLQRIADQELP